MRADQNAFPTDPCFWLGERWITPSLNEIDGVRVEPKMMDVLVALAEASPGVISGKTLLNRVWPDVIVVDNVVYHTIAQLRKALGDDARVPRYIETVPRRGYRLIAAIQRAASNTTSAEPTERSQNQRAAARTFDGHAPSIAVMPLSNVSPDPQQEHFVDGLTVELVHRLSRIPNVRVVGQTSSFAYKNRVVNVAEVGRTLGVTHLLAGSVRRADDQLRVTVELVSTADGFQLWSADFDRKLDDIFAIQRDIGESVAEALSVKLRGVSFELIGCSRNVLAHSHFLRGNALFWQFTVETTERAIAELETAVTIDPFFARAWVRLAEGYGARSRHRELTEQSLRHMAAAVERSLQLEPLLWVAHVAKGFYLLSRRRFIDADLAFQEASRLRRAGQESITHPGLMNYLHQVGRWTERLEEIEHLRSADPALSAYLPQTLYVLDRKKEAHNAYVQLRGLSQHADREYLTLLAMDEPTAEAADRIMEGFSNTRFGRRWYGRTDEVLVALRRRLAAGSSIRGDFASSAMVAAHHDDTDLAIDFLRGEYLVDGFGAFYHLWYPQLKQVRASPRFKAFLNELGLPEMWRSTGSWGDFGSDYR